MIQDYEVCVAWLFKALYMWTYEKEENETAFYYDILHLLCNAEEPDKYQLK